MTALKPIFVTSSRGNLYRGYCAGQAGAFTVYACIKLGSKDVEGYCACDTQGIFGPLCYTVDSALTRAKNVSQVMQRDMLKRQK